MRRRPQLVARAGYPSRVRPSGPPWRRRGAVRLSCVAQRRRPLGRGGRWARCLYESRGLIEPKRSAKGTRLYSHADVERLRRIQEMTVELGLNLAGVERVFELELLLEQTSRRVAALERRAAELKAEVERLEALRRELRAEIVPYVRGGALVRRSEFA